MPELAEHRGAFLVVHRAESTRGGRRPVEVDDHLAVRVCLLRDAAAARRVAPRPGPVLGAQEVEGQQRGNRIGIGAVTLERLADLAVQFETLAEREALVGGLLEQGVAEADLLAVAVGYELSAADQRAGRRPVSTDSAPSSWPSSRRSNDRPSTEARRSTRRGVGARASISRMATASRVSGSDSTSVARTIRSSSSKNSGLPPARATTASRLVRAQRRGLGRDLDELPRHVVGQDARGAAGSPGPKV